MFISTAHKASDLFVYITCHNAAKLTVTRNHNRSDRCGLVSYLSLLQSMKYHLAQEQRCLLRCLFILSAPEDIMGH
jgi:hypothetical protein